MPKNMLDTAVRSLLLQLLGPTRSMVRYPQRLTRHLHYKGPVEVDLADGCRFTIYSYGHAIENKLFWYGKNGHEPETLIPWVKCAAKSAVVLDIGANSGLYSLAASAVNTDARVFAFEPLHRVAEIIRKNVSLNPGFNIQVCELAVCDECKLVEIYDPGGDQPASASMLKGFLTCDTRKVQIPGVSIDDFVNQQQINRVDLIKLDVEGVEELALKGMANVLKRWMPTLFIEVLDDRPELMRELKKLLDLGYQCADLRPSGVLPISSLSGVGSQRNLLFARDLTFF